MSREAAFLALFNLLSNLVENGQITTLDRRVKLIETCDHSELPAIFMGASKQKVVQNAEGTFAIRYLGAELFVYAQRPDDTTPASAILNTLIDTIETALAPDWSGSQTLGGLVHHCWIEGDILVFDGKLSERAAAIIPIIILLP